MEKFPEDQLPAVMIASPGLVDPPTADGRGVYTARWRLTTATAVAARGNRLALRLARLYALATRALMLQQQQLGDLAVRRIDWLGERYDVLASVDDRSICVGAVEVSVEVSDVTTRQAGPLEPVMGPGTGTEPDSPTWPTAETVEVEVHKEEL